MGDDERTSVAFEQQEAAIPPVWTAISTSAPTCSLKGEPPFTVITKYENTGSRSICALVRLYSHHGSGIEIRDPSRNHRRIGPPSTMIQDDFDEEAQDLEDTQLVRLEPGQTFETSYTFSVVPKLDGIRNSDVRNMVVGNTYVITLKKRRWRWVFEDEMPHGLDDEEARHLLRKRHAAEWSVDCTVRFDATE